MKVHRRQRIYTLIELAATLQGQPELLSIWIEGVGDAYRWGTLKEFREVANEMLYFDRPAYPVLMQIEGRLHPISSIDVHGNRLVLQAIAPLPIPDLSRRERVSLPA